MSSWSISEPSFLTSQALKYICRLWWLISPNSVWSYPAVFSCCLLRLFGSLAGDPTRMRSELTRKTDEQTAIDCDILKKNLSLSYCVVVCYGTCFIIVLLFLS